MMSGRGSTDPNSGVAAPKAAAMLGAVLPLLLVIAAGPGSKLDLNPGSRATG
jgi:hypothetical protein